MQLYSCDSTHRRKPYYPGGCFDFDGNAAVQKSVVFKVDTVPPTLNITSPADGMVTNNTSITLIGKTNDITSKR